MRLLSAPYWLPWAEWFHQLRVSRDSTGERLTVRRALYRYPAERSQV